MHGQDRRLIKLDHYYYYQCRVPARFRAYDARDKFRPSLRMGAIMVARESRDLMEAADNDYWTGLLGLEIMGDGDSRYDDLKSTVY